MKKQKIIVSVTNDLVVDQRVHKVCTFLLQNNFDVTLVGRKLKTSQDINREYKTKRFRLIFTKGMLFYANYNFRLFFYLLFHKSHVLLSNDLDTLLANYLVSKIKKTKLVYDTHEYFTEVPELINRPFVKKVWERIEKAIFPNLKYVYTVNESLAKVFERKYKVQVLSVKNVPFYSKLDAVTKHSKKTVLYQGALNKDRGLEELIEAFIYLEDIELQIIGGGDVENELKNLVVNLDLENKVKFIGKIPFDKLKYYTQKAHLGVSIEKATNLNYQYALPNKLFDYISCNLPVLTSDLIEIKKIVETYKIGVLISAVDPKTIANSIQNLITNEDLMRNYIENTKIAAKELCWENEIEVLKRIYLNNEG
jgi:glycosyltransferase involved in cell wall biosynthesis